jgi:multiple sugar transport system substrate-binding protein
MEALTCCTMEHIWGYDGNVLDENGNPTFDTEAVKSGISSMKKILDEGVAIDGILGMMSKDVKAAFFAGQVLYIRDWSAALAAANDPEQSSVAGNVKVAQLPAGTDGNEQYNCNGGWNIGVSAYSSHKEEAKLLVKYWTSDDAMLIGATMSGKMPARPACLLPIPIWQNYMILQRTAVTVPVLPITRKFLLHCRKVSPAY